MEVSKNNIRLLFYTCTATIVIGLIVLLNIMFIDTFNNQADDQLVQLEVSVMDMKKIYVKDVVDVTIQNIEIERELVFSREQQKVLDISTHLKTLLNTETDISEIVDHINDDHVINNINELIIYDFLDKTIFYSYNSKFDSDDDTSMEAIISHYQDYGIKETIQNEYYLIVVAVPDDYYDNYTKEIIKDRIRKQRFVDNGYIWINHILDYEGGEDYAIRLVHPNLPETEGTYLSTTTEDIQGNRPYQAELDGINNQGDLFNEYFFKKLDDDTVAHKLSYAKLYEPYDWIIATGVYLDDVDLLISKESEELLLLREQVIEKAILLSLAAVVLSVIVIILFERMIISLISKFQNTINQKNQKIQNDMVEIERLAYLDPLTGILNRRSMMLKLSEAMEEAKRYNHGFSIAIADIDDFKHINDTDGHIAGDSVLVNLSRLFQEIIRANDAVSRWGGEEFLVLLRHSDPITSLTKFEQIRALVEESEFAFDGKAIRLTLSIGLASFDETIGSYEELIKIADSNLYKAKTTGKNKVIG